ncbi:MULTISPECIES: YybH family protein [Rhodonellum]|uniref:DUF4440 domain-containing protein n=1 Tax=Rhodonellum ikkaensis TaxID=336829 RepID=A0A1H3RGW4_9BACT|nr:MULTISPECIES: nuclear transport factor 2 family protein [Rhodonellum]SDZ24448.1 protein of unknown function [Rhodonellum ikkaensis]
MKYFALVILVLNLTTQSLFAQQGILEEDIRKELYALIEQYNEARDNKDTLLLKTILTPEIDQLVSSGEWRTGIDQAIDGMMRSSAANPGSRNLIVDKIRLLDQASAILDCRYEIENPDGPTRKMWSTFLAVFTEGRWKITGIRNMLPTSTQN